MYPSTTSQAFRALYGGSVSVRSSGEDQIIKGIAMPYGKWARIGTKDNFFMERIQRGALEETLADGHAIICTIDHNEKETIGDTRSNLSLYDRPDGLHFDLTPNNDRAIHLIDGVRKGFFDKCSFIFKRTQWFDEELGGVIWRTIKKMELFEISLVDRPAYESTSANVQGSSGSSFRGFGEDVKTAMEGNGIRYSAHRR